uniref:Helicase ATP-binding domain-containing protein n=1 Tax=Angiostrongylus cantonensis TaxID=6313 RepID=A0A0K0DHA3_ANGCA
MSQPDSKELTKTPAGFLCPLKEHQMAGLTWMKWRESLSPKGGILADEMGLGKTLLVIALIATGKCEREQRRLEGKDSEDKDRSSIVRQQSLTPSNATLIIAPAALIYHWEDEVNQRCEVGLLKVAVYHTNRKLARNDIVITSYMLVANELRSDDHVNLSNTLAKIHWSRIVLDEAHCIKNRKTKAAKAVCRLSSDARWCVTGTPVHNNLWDLYSFLRFLNVDHFSEERFWKEYVMLSTKKSAERLNLLMKNYVLRREKNSVSPITETRLVRVWMSCFCFYCCHRFQVTVFLRLVSNPSTKIGKMGCMLVMLLRLRQACIHFHLTKNVTTIYSRQDRVKCFNEDKKGTNVMLVSISAGGVGLNLTGGNHLILMDLHWNPALELQACDRVHRMGQTREVHIHKLIMKQSIEERVLSLQMKKMGLAENVLKGLVYFPETFLYGSSLMSRAKFLRIVVVIIFQSSLEKEHESHDGGSEISI